MPLTGRVTEVPLPCRGIFGIRRDEGERDGERKQIAGGAGEIVGDRGGRVIAPSQRVQSQ